MRNIQIIHTQHHQRHRMIPLEPPQQLIRHRGNHPAQRQQRPRPTQQPHVPILVPAFTFMRLLVARRRPEQLDPEQPVLDGRQVGVRLHHHDVLHGKAVLGFGPEAEDQGAVDDRGDGKGEVPVLEPLGAEEEEEGPRDGGDKDAEGYGRVVEEALFCGTDCQKCGIGLSVC